MDKLKKCPFCGGEAYAQNEFSDNIDSYRIICDSCFCSTDRYWCEEMAITAWNTRAETEAEKRIEAVRAECERAITDAECALDGNDFCDDFPEGRMKACKGILRILEGEG